MALRIMANLMAGRKSPASSGSIKRAASASRGRVPTSQIAALWERADFYFLPSAGTVSATPAHEHIEMFEVVPLTGEQHAIQLAGSINHPVPSVGPTGGFSIRVDDALEKAVSTKTIRVSAIVRAIGSDETQLGLAYSTNERGNSGWSWLPAREDWSTVWLDYVVPLTVGGMGDFIGLLPAELGKPGVEICALGVEIRN